jgi:hypothetical protein
LEWRCKNEKDHPKEHTSSSTSSMKLLGCEFCCECVEVPCVEHEPEYKKEHKVKHRRSEYVHRKVHE